MAWLKKGWWKVLILIAFLFALYAVTRLTLLTNLPIFTDEAIYIRWSQIGSRDASWRFISLTDGKQPMFTWATMVFLKFIKDPIVAGRMVSVVSGFFSAIGIWFVTNELFKNKRTATISSFLYILSPFTLVYDRMALYDSMVAMFSIWNLYFAILLVRYVRLDIALILGLTLGAGMLNKSSGFLSMYMLPFTLVLFDWKNNPKLKRLGRWIVFALVAAVLSEGVYSVLRLSPLFGMISQKDAVFVYPFREWLIHPFRFVYGNLRGEFDWLRTYLTDPIFFLSTIPIFIFGYKMREKLLLYLWWFLPFLALALFGRILYPRFILFMSLPLIVVASVSLDWLFVRFSKSYVRFFLFGILLFPSVFSDYSVITNPAYAAIPVSDKSQYVNDWPAGWGVKEVNAYLLAQSKNGKVAVFTEGTFGLLPYSIEIYLVDNPNVEIHGIWPLPQEEPAEMIKSAKEKPTFFVLNESQNPPAAWPLSLISQYQKGSRQDRSLRFYRVLPVQTNAHKK